MPEGLAWLAKPSSQAFEFEKVGARKYHEVDLDKARLEQLEQFELNYARFELWKPFKTSREGGFQASALFSEFRSPAND